MPLIDTLIPTASIAVTIPIQTYAQRLFRSRYVKCKYELTPRTLRNAFLKRMKIQYTRVSSTTLPDRRAILMLSAIARLTLTQTSLPLLANTLLNSLISIIIYNVTTRRRKQLQIQRNSVQIRSQQGRKTSLIQSNACSTTLLSVIIRILLLAKTQGSFS